MKHNVCHGWTKADKKTKNVLLIIGLKKEELIKRKKQTSIAKGVTEKFKNCETLSSCSGAVIWEMKQNKIFHKSITQFPVYTQLEILCLRLLSSRKTNAWGLFDERFGCVERFESSKSFKMTLKFKVFV